MTVVETVARAMFERAAVRAGTAHREYLDQQWLKDRALRQKWGELARAAIAAMRKPTKEMIAMGGIWVKTALNHGDTPADIARVAWDAMIDLAHEQPEGKV